MEGAMRFSFSWRGVGRLCDILGTFGAVFFFVVLALNLAMGRAPGWALVISAFATGWMVNDVLRDWVAGKGPFS